MSSQLFAHLDASAKSGPIVNSYVDVYVGGYSFEILTLKIESKFSLFKI